MLGIVHRSMSHRFRVSLFKHIFGSPLDDAHTITFIRPILFTRVLNKNVLLVNDGHKLPRGLADPYLQLVVIELRLSPLPV